jgi:hypothetical protein
MELDDNKSEEPKPPRIAWVFMFVLITLNVGSGLWVRLTFDYFHEIEWERNPTMNLAIPFTPENEDSASRLVGRVFAFPFLIQIISLFIAVFLGVMPWRTEVWGWTCLAAIIISLVCLWSGFDLYVRCFID